MTSAGRPQSCSPAEAGRAPETPSRPEAGARPLSKDEKPAHTPGPWAIHHIRGSRDGRQTGENPSLLPWFIVPAEHASRKLGGAVDPVRDLAKFAQPICNFEGGRRHRSDEEVRANARLVAAAPQLLEALEATLLYLQGNASKAYGERIAKVAEAALRAARPEVDREH